MKQLFLTSLSLTLLMGLLWTQTACNRAATPDKYKGRQLVMGSGGGITGFVTTYYLLDNRKLFVRNGRDTMFTFLNRQPEIITRQLFQMAEDTCNIKTTTFDHPGNLYKFAQWNKGEQSHKVTWGDREEKVPASYTKLYNSFMAIVPPDSVLDK